MQGSSSSKIYLSHNQPRFQSAYISPSYTTEERKLGIRPCTAEELEQLKVKMSMEGIGSLAIAETRDCVNRIIKEWPPEQYTYVGIGRSPTLLIAEIHARLVHNSNLFVL